MYHTHIANDNPEPLFRAVCVSVHKKELILPLSKNHSSWNFAIARNLRYPRNLVFSAHSANLAHSAKSRAIPAIQ